MVSRMFLLGVVVLAIPVAAMAQETVNEVPVTQADLEALRTEMRSDLKAALDAISHQIEGLKNADPGPAPSPSLLSRVAALEEAQRVIQDVQHDQAVVLGQIARRGADNNYHWRFDTNSQSARQEFDRALKSSTPRKGKFTVHNRMNTDQRIVINGYQKYIVAGARDEFEVNTGTVTTQLPGQQPMNWVVGLPNYTHSIEIKPTYTPVTRGRWIYTTPDYVSDAGWAAPY